ncbi:MAG: trypsin-like peptidase domain-containing protein [Candidatus Humimicrobiaceae bacterium]
MKDYDFDKQDKRKSFFIKGCISIIAAAIFIVIGALFMLGTLSIVYKVSPGGLLTGNAGISARSTKEDVQADNSQDDQTAELEKPREKIDLPGLEEKIGGKEFLLEEFDNAVSRIVEEVKPMVVNIRVRAAQKNSQGDEVFAEGLGSGVIFTSDGYIITNNHVAGAADEIIVTLFDGREYPAELIAGDPNTDIAVIKIEAEGTLEAASFISIDDVKVGELVIAVGSPFGLQQTVTTGVISAKGRDITLSPVTLPMVNLIQTDAAINQGNSGGPLINSSGQVIGINTLIFSPSGGSAGIGFSIPSDTAVNIAEQIINYGRARIPYIGIEMGGDIETDVVGVYIVNTLEGYPAREAGIKTGDVIVKFDGVSVSTPFEIFAEILKRNVGQEVDIRIYRDGKYLTLSLILAEAPYTENNGDTE